MKLNILNLLEKYKQEKGITVSLYLDVDASKRSFSDIKAALNSLITEVSKKHKDNKTDVEKILKKIEEYLINNFDRSRAKSIALFSVNDQIVKHIKVPVSLPDELVVEKDFYLRPLVSVIRRVPNFLTLFLSRSKYLLGKYSDGEFNIIEREESEVPNQVRGGGWLGFEENKIRRHIDEHVRRHLNKAFSRLKENYSKNSYDGWLLGYHAEIKSFVQKMIPVTLKDDVLKYVGLGPEIEEQDLKNIVYEVVPNIIKSEEEKKLKEIKKTFSTGGKAVKGLAGVVREANASAIEELIVSVEYKSLAMFVIKTIS